MSSESPVCDRNANINSGSTTIRFVVVNEDERKADGSKQKMDGPLPENTKAEGPSCETNKMQQVDKVQGNVKQVQSTCSQTPDDSNTFGQGDALKLPKGESNSAASQTQTTKVYFRKVNPASQSLSSYGRLVARGDGTSAKILRCPAFNLKEPMTFLASQGGIGATTIVRKPLFDDVKSRLVGASGMQKSTESVISADDNAGPNAAYVPGTNVEYRTPGANYKNKNGRVKRPMNAFMVWARDFRGRLAAAMPTATNSEISITLGQVWANLHMDEKRQYYEIAERIKMKHRQDFPDWVYQPAIQRREELNATRPTYHVVPIAPQEIPVSGTSGKSSFPVSSASGNSSLPASGTSDSQSIPVSGAFCSQSRPASDTPGHPSHSITSNVQGQQTGSVRHCMSDITSDGMCSSSGNTVRSSSSTNPAPSNDLPTSSTSLRPTISSDIDPKIFRPNVPIQATFKTDQVLNGGSETKRIPVYLQRVSYTPVKPLPRVPVDSHHVTMRTKDLLANKIYQGRTQVGLQSLNTGRGDILLTPSLQRAIAQHTFTSVANSSRQTLLPASQATIEGPQSNVPASPITNTTVSQALTVFQAAGVSQPVNVFQATNVSSASKGMEAIICHSGSSSSQAPTGTHLINGSFLSRSGKPNGPATQLRKSLPIQYVQTTGSERHMHFQSMATPLGGVKNQTRANEFGLQMNNTEEATNKNSMQRLGNLTNKNMVTGANGNTSTSYRNQNSGQTTPKPGHEVDIQETYTSGIFQPFLQGALHEPVIRHVLQQQTTSPVPAKTETDELWPFPFSQNPQDWGKDESVDQLYLELLDPYDPLLVADKLLTGTFPGSLNLDVDRWKRYLEDSDDDEERDGKDKQPSDPLDKLRPTEADDICISPLPLKETLRRRLGVVIQESDNGDVITGDLTTSVNVDGRRIGTDDASGVIVKLSKSEASGITEELARSFGAEHTGNIAQALSHKGAECSESSSLVKYVVESVIDEIVSSLATNDKNIDRTEIDVELEGTRTSSKPALTTDSFTLSDRSSKSMSKCNKEDELKELISDCGDVTTDMSTGIRLRNKTLTNVTSSDDVTITPRRTRSRSRAGCS